MVELRQTWDLKWKDSKWANIPATLIEQFEGKPFLKLRPSNATLVQLLAGSEAGKNASFSTSEKLSTLLSLRNEAALKKYDREQAKAEGEEGNVNRDMFASEDEDDDDENCQASKKEVGTAKKKRRVAVPPGDYVVQFEFGKQTIECLAQGQRPARSDLMIHMVPDQLNAIFEALAQDSENWIKAEKRSYKKKDKK